MRAIGVAREFENLGIGEFQDLLEAAANSHKDLLALLGGSALAASDIAVSATRNALSYCASPDTDTEESLADIDDDTHDLTVLLVLQGLANGSEHGVQPKFVDVNGTLIFELVRPFAAVLILGVLPFWPYALLEKVVVGLQGQLGDWCDIVL